MFYLSFPAIGESKKRLFVRTGAPLGTSGLTDVAACISQLERASLGAGGGDAELGPGRTSNGAVKLERSPGGWAEEKPRTPGLDGDTDDRGGWEKGTPSWKKVRQKRGWKGGKVQKKRSSLVEDCIDDVSPDYVPNKRRSDNKLVRKATQPSSVYTQPDQRVRGTPQPIEDS